MFPRHEENHNDNPVVAYSKQFKRVSHIEKFVLRVFPHVFGDLCLLIFVIILIKFKLNLCLVILINFIEIVRCFVEF